MVDEQVAVLIVGGGIVGLSAALFLQKQNIPFILVERHSTTSIHPRARGVNNRTMELYREIGIEEAVKEAGASLAPAIGILNGKTLVEALEGFDAGSAREAFAGMVGALGGVSPTEGARVTQDFLEPTLLTIARQRGGNLRFFTELVSFDQDEEGITTVIANRATGKQSTVRASYLLAADGANSPIRRQLGASVSGPGTVGHLLNILFKADLRELVRGRELSICRIDNEQVMGLFTSIDFKDRWVFHLVYDPSKGKAAAQFSPERIKELLKIALGLPEIEIEIKSILPWESAMRVVDNFQHGRIFFAGDAAHQMPPWGGQGANSGVADVHNLAWKLAAVLKGQAPYQLLSTYNAERRPVDYLAAVESTAAADEQGLMSMKGSPGVNRARFPRILGYYLYQNPSQAIIAEAEPVPSQNPLGLDGRPGTRAPHVWIEKQGQRISTLDLFGSHFVILTGAEGGIWCEAAQKIATHLRVELDAYRIGPGADLLDTEGLWLSKAGIQSGGALLIRPDGYVAWRSREIMVDPGKTLEDVLTHLLCQLPEPV